MFFFLSLYESVFISRFNPGILIFNLLLCFFSTTKNCSELYELFETAVRYKPYCNMNMSTYEIYFQRALEGVHVINKVR